MLMVRSVPMRTNPRLDARQARLAQTARALSTSLGNRCWVGGSELPSAGSRIALGKSPNPAAHLSGGGG